MPRERAIPCRGATLKESIAGTHKTWADDGYCDRCRVLAAQSIAMVRANSSREERVRVPQVPSSASPPACPDLAVSSQHGTAPARGQVIFGDFLSVSRPGGQLQGFPSAGTGPSEGRAVHRPT